ncbi:hypothetical protein SAICODRAFT_4614 [Saitoella complicata NRRL Y-17804]|uniref:uncharacterized protein n=1 Tax=Saitoella complicata (strain BCRC 22490 / CBS 7301 / JCM 7358 / NBRC 10748 / NRRL Y-17804) TaxID=698492 RepID=UPI000866ECE8|nr:uncharacterized protein SAICODRAFT_4614 [Saitoella complicata NRRL Y-17804]ODQ56434.1 hypothetical protein SAICODRAFT_4614 [Saitoella complicata NRRL Y-17804]
MGVMNGEQRARRESLPSDHIHDPIRVQSALNEKDDEIARLQNEMYRLRQVNMVQKREIDNLKELVQHLQEKLGSSDAQA